MSSGSFANPEARSFKLFALDQINLQFSVHEKFECLRFVPIVCFKKIYNQVWVLKSMKIREIWTTKYIEWLVRTRQIVL